MTSDPIADRIDRWRAKLDEKLAELPTDAARREFLDRETARWERLYNDWIGDPSLMPPDVTDFDFRITLCDIDTRRIKYGSCVIELVE